MHSLVHKHTPLVATEGLPRLLDALAPKRVVRETASGRVPLEQDGGGGGGASAGLVLIVLLYAIGAALLITGTALSVDTASYRTDALLIGGDLAPPFVSVLVTNLLLYTGFMILSGTDAAFYLCTNPTITGAALGLGLSTTGLSGGIAIISAMQCSQTTCWVWIGAFVAGCLVLAMQLATMLSILVKSNSPLLRAIRESL